jgi:hypothetical protein
MDSASTAPANGSNEHTFQIFPGRSYTVLVTPSATFDAEPSYVCTGPQGSASGTFDWGWEGQAETFSLDATFEGTCTITVRGYGGATGDYSITVNAS